MAYTLQAIIADRVLLSQERLPEGGQLISLAQNKVMFPLTKTFRENHGVSSLPFTDEGQTVPEALVEICRKLSEGGRLAYVEAEIFGGVGTQACFLWEDGALNEEPLVSKEAINCALQFLGVAKSSYHDEFEALGLGKYRNTNDWLE